MTGAHPAHAPGFKARTARGFTLIEVLMVVLLVGIIAGIIVLAASPSSPERSIATEMDRLASIVSLAMDEAQAENRELGLKVLETGYGFVAFDEAKQVWQPYLADDSFRPRELPEGIRLRIVRESQVKLPRRPPPGSKPADNPDDAARWEPDVLFLSSGEATPVLLEFSAPEQADSAQTLEINVLGGIVRSDRVTEPARG